MTSTGMRAEEHTSQLVHEGYTLFEDAYDPDDVSFFRRAIVELYEGVGRPRCYSKEVVVLAPAVHVAQTGLIVAKLVERRPEFAPRLLRPLIVDSIRGVLGVDMYLELTASVIADDTRVFFAWHTHIGGQDDRAFRASGVWPEVPRARRIGALLYLDDLTDENGPLLIYPRATGTPTRPPHDLEKEHWEGEVVARVRRGTVVAMDECTWHAARQKTSPGLRILLGCNFVAADAPQAPLIEHSLGSHSDGCGLLRSVVPPSSAL
jgi:hypothetical protein